MEATTNTANYTDAMVERMVQEYQANPSRETIDNLASFFGKSSRSIIAKLSREGVYQAAPRTTKAGGPVIPKARFVQAIEAHLDASFPTLAKAGKQDLAKLAEVLGVTVEGA